MRPFPRHRAFYVAAAGGVLACLSALWLMPLLAIVIAANTFFLLYLGLTLGALPQLTADFLRRHAASSDEPVWVIFAVTFGTVIVAIVALFLTVNAQGAPRALDLILSLAAVPLGWLTIHIMTAIHYAHLFWQPGEKADETSKAHPGPQGGLDFPGTKSPGGVDFVYYALVIGMTAQTADVDITTVAMRKVTMLHSVTSFFFNTVLVAAAVNVAVTLAN